MSYLLDTSWIIEALRGNQEIAERLRVLKPAGLATSIISVAELYAEVFRSRDPERPTTLRHFQ
jgi:predicted nucleic acid-binding protein